MKNTIPLSLLLATSCIKTPDLTGYDLPNSDVASSYCNAVLEYGTYDFNNNTVRYSPNVHNGSSFLPHYASIIRLSENNQPETIIFRITTPTIQEEDCVEMFVDNLPFGNLDQRYDSFGINGDCETIYNQDLARHLSHKTNRIGDKLDYATIPMQHINSKTSSFLEARYLETLVVAQNQF